MAARKTRLAQWKAYVYALTYADDILYIGKGVKRRLRQQMTSFGLSGHEIARFQTEGEAYSFERECIARHNPHLNKHPGGNGSFSVEKKEKHYPDFAEIERIGTRAYASKILLWWHNRWSLPLDPAQELTYWKVFNGRTV